MAVAQGTGRRLDPYALGERPRAAGWDASRDRVVQSRVDDSQLDNEAPKKTIRHRRAFLKLRAVVLVVVMASTLFLVATGANAAGLGQCRPFTSAQEHQGGYEPAVHPGAYGAVAVIRAREVDLCDNPVLVNDNWDSGSTVYVMLTNYSAQAPGWYQTGWVKYPGYRSGSCSVHYTQYLFEDFQSGPGTTFTTIGNCVVGGTEYRYKLRIDGNDTRSFARRVSDDVIVWESPRDPEGIEFEAQDAEYSAEVFNNADVSGGNTSNRSWARELAWWNVNDVKVNAVIQGGSGGHRFCQRCGSEGPYNTDWLSSDYFEVWTNG